MHRTPWGKALLLSAATTLLWPAESSFARNERSYGAGSPFTLNELPPGILKQQLEGLTPAAQKRAMGWLHRFNFGEQDLPMLRADRTGGIFYEDPAHEEVETAPAEAPVLSELTASQTFKLHSRPGASRTVYLDMDGHVVTNTVWNGTYSTLDMRPYDTDGNESGFSQSELNDIAEVWKRVAEDFAPYDIDVTTEAPPSFGANVGHILVTRKADKLGRVIYDCSCGGVAYVGVWGQSYYPQYQPALVFIDGVGGPHNISEAASHELGHNLNLSHDGTSTVGYYTGHGAGNTDWGPIMGVGYYAQVTQWSRGEYADANNTQDDLQIIADRLSYRSDDHADVEFANATPLLVSSGGVVAATNPVTDPANASPANKGVIEHRSDVDLFVFDAGDGVVNLSVTPAWTDFYTGSSRRGSNLDLNVVLYDEFGFEVARSNPESDTFAQISQTVTAGRYLLAVEGVGVGDPATNGYSDYGSLGQYFITGTLPETTVLGSAPVAPGDLMAVLSGSADIALYWSDPLAAPLSNETGYRVYRQRDGGAFSQIASLPQDSIGYTDNNLESGSYVYRVEPYNSYGANSSNLTAPVVISGPSVAWASAEQTLSGSLLSGSYLDTRNTGSREQLVEQHQGGKPKSRVSQLAHRWTIAGVKPAASVMLEVDAAAPANVEGDDFVFAYSLDGVSYTPFATLLNGTGRQLLSVQLPASAYGTVYLRVEDNDRTVGNGATDALDIYLIRVTSNGEAGNLPPAVTISEPAAATVVTVGEPVVLAASASDLEDGELSASIEWRSDRDGILGQGAAIETDTLSIGVHQITAQVADSAQQMGSASVSVTVRESTPPVAPLAITGMTPSAVTATQPVAVVISGSGFASGASLSLMNGSGPAPAIANLRVIDSQTLSATITAKDGGPRTKRPWDLLVTNPDGRSAVCTGCLSVVSP